MSIQSEINRIKTDKESLITALAEKGIEVAEGATLGDIATSLGDAGLGGESEIQIFSGEIKPENGIFNLGFKPTFINGICCSTYSGDTNHLNGVWLNEFLIENNYLSAIDSDSWPSDGSYCVHSFTYDSTKGLGVVNCINLIDTYPAHVMFETFTASMNFVLLDNGLQLINNSELGIFTFPSDFYYYVTAVQTSN